MKGLNLRSRDKSDVRRGQLSGCIAHDFKWSLLSAVAAAMVLLLLLPRAVSAGPLVPAQGSTSPDNGDLNPYGLAVVPPGFPAGVLQPGQLLVSNFNNGAADGNVQGQGSTIVAINPNNAQQLGVFFQGTPPIGFSNALQIARAGFVFAGSVFTNSSGTDPMDGGLLVLNSDGKLVTRIKTAGQGGKGGPWGLAIDDEGAQALLFVSNVLDGTVTRIQVSFFPSFTIIGSPTVIASGYAFGLDQTAVAVGPAGLAYDGNRDILYVAAEDDNEIFAIHNASHIDSSDRKGSLVFTSPHLHGPLGLIIAPNGDLITANADPTAHLDATEPSELVEFTTGGSFVRELSIDPTPGSVFTILKINTGSANQFFYVDDIVSNINILRLALN